MTDHDAFVRAICAAPDDDTARLVYADYLDDHGDPDRGEFIRVEVALARRDPDDPAAEARRPALFARRADLFKRHRQRWLGPFLPFAKDVKFDRGFVGEVEVAADAFLAHGPRWLEITPLTRARFATSRVGVYPVPSPARAEPLFASPLLGRLEKIDLERAGVTAADVELFARQPDLSRLRELVLSWNDVRSRGVVALAGMPQLARLESLSLVGNEITAAGGRALAESPHLGGLKELWVDRNPLGDRTWQALALRFGAALMG